MVYGLPPFYSTNVDEMYQGILHKPLKLKSTVSVEMRSFLSKILEKNPENRLGHAADGWSQIQNHSFFRQINFSDLLLKKYRPDFIPAVVSFSSSWLAIFRRHDKNVSGKWLHYNWEKSQMMIVLNGYLTLKVWLEKHYTKRYYPDVFMIFFSKEMLTSDWSMTIFWLGKPNGWQVYRQGIYKFTCYEFDKQNETRLHSKK